MLYLLALATCQCVDLALSGPDYQLGNKKHMLQITVQFTENVWTLTANTSVSTNVCISFLKSLRTLITRSSVYFRAKQTLNYQWILNHLWTTSLRVLKLSNQVWNFMKDINALLKDEHLFAWCDMYYMGAWVWQKAEIHFTALKSILCRSNGSDMSLNVLRPSTVFFFSK